MSLTREQLDAALDKTVSMTSQKGGVAKSTTTAQYAAILARLGFKVLVVDTDPGAGMTALTGTGITAEHPYSVTDLMKETADPSECVHAAAVGWQPDINIEWQRGGAITDGGSVSVIPSPGQYLQAVADERPAAAHLRLWKGLHESGLSSDYDVVLIDCHPSTGATTELAILSSGWALFPVEPEMLGTRGFADGVRAVTKFAEDWRHPLACAGVVFTKVNARTKEHKEGMEGTIEWVSTMWPDSGYPEEDPRAAFASGIWTPVVPDAAMVAAANGRGEPASSALPGLFTAIGDIRIGSENQIRVVASFMRHALNLTALLAPHRYLEILDAVRVQKMPNVMREVLFESPLKFKPGPTTEPAATTLEGAH